MSTGDAYRAHRDAAQANSELTAKVRRLEAKPKGLQKAEIARLLGLPEKATDRMIVQKIHALMTKAGQPVGAERLKRALTVRNAEEKKRTLIPFEGEWREAFSGEALVSSPAPHAARDAYNAGYTGTLSVTVPARSVKIFIKK